MDAWSQVIMQYFLALILDSLLLNIENRSGAEAFLMTVNLRASFFVIYPFPQEPFDLIEN